MKFLASIPLNLNFVTILMPIAFRLLVFDCKFVTIMHQRFKGTLYAYLVILNLKSSNSSCQPDFHKTRMSRTSMFPAAAYSPPEDSLSQDVIATVEKSMKKYTDNLMRFLEGISSRLSQLELYCYNLDKSIGEMRADLNHSNGEADTKLKSLEKHLQEVSYIFN